MRPLSAQDAPRVWERARGQHGVDRAITLLATACPDMTRHDLASLSLGQRDARLLTLRERTFGPQLDGLADCPNCEEQLQISLAVSDIRVAQENQADAEPMELKANGLRAPFRLPNSSDLAAAAHCPDVAAARRLLLERCLVQPDADAPVSPTEVAPEAVLEIAASMARRDPQAEVLLDLDCPACNHRWQILFDIASFFYAEISAYAKRLLREVHTLARRYGWREADILSMSTARRQFYIELPGQ